MSAESATRRMPHAPQASVFGLLGRTLAHSWSPHIHAHLGSTPYTLFEREPHEVEHFIRKGTWRGINVTIPYKARAFELSDEQSERARALGVANTLIRRADGTIFADNTDAGGFSWMLERFCRRRLGSPANSLLKDASVLVLGSGGAGQAVRLALEEVGARVTTISRSGRDTYATLSSHTDALLLVNATPVGMYPNCPASPLTDEVFSALTSLRGVLDVVYNPQKTGLCLQAEHRGIPFESGLAMLIAQARLSAELFLGYSLSDTLIEDLERDLRGQMENIILIGMPGAGKTSTGMVLAHQLNRPFVDIDTAFQIAHGISAGEFITQQGEDAFRTQETQVVSSYAKQSGLVIACGGGVVVRPENYELLHQNGRIVLLDRSLDQLSTSGRPLSQTQGIAQLATERMPRYRAWADIIIACSGTPASDARAIQEHLSL